MQVQLITPFALTLAEALTARADWLDNLKKARRRSRTITHEEYAITKNAYRQAKVRTRQALADFRVARETIAKGGTPPVDDAMGEALRKYGWEL